VIIDLLPAKLPSSLVRKWQRTVPHKRMPAYTHFMDFLQTRANSDDIRSTSQKSSHHRQHQPRGQVYHTISSTLKCPTCQGPHAIKDCKVFKGKSVTERFDIAKKASLCTNCLNKGHSLKQFSASSCHTCGQRHHTALHRKPTQVKPRIQRTRSLNDPSSNAQSSSDRSSSGRLSSGQQFELTLATTASSRLPQFIRHRASWNEMQHSSSYYRANPIPQNTDTQQQ
jgi:ribosomal protein L32